MHNVLVFAYIAVIIAIIALFLLERYVPRLRGYSVTIDLDNLIVRIKRFISSGDDVSEGIFLIAVISAGFLAIFIYCFLSALVNSGMEAARIYMILLGVLIFTILLLMLILMKSGIFVFSRDESEIFEEEF